MAKRRKRTDVGKVSLQVRGSHRRAFLQIELELSSSLRRSLLRQLEKNTPMKQS
jgi:hypothetical protein